MQDVLDLLDVDADTLARRVRCPAATFLGSTREGGCGVLCGVIELDNAAEGASMEVPAVVSARRSPATIALYCAGRGLAGDPTPAEELEELAGQLDPDVAHERFSFTSCPVWADEIRRLDEARRRFEADGVLRVEHPDRPDGPSAVRA